MGLNFRSATPEELDRIFAIYRDAIRVMKQNGIEQWDEIYPNREILSEDIENQQLTIGYLGDEIVSVYVLNEECSEGYENGKWNYPDSSCLLIHRLCVSPAFQNCGIGSQTLAHIEEEVRKRGKRSIRLDAFPQNPFAMRMYGKRGYQITGDLYLRKGRFCLMEKGV